MSKLTDKVINSRFPMKRAYPFHEIEPKWQKYWRERRIFEVDLTTEKRPKYYCLVMFPYPSAALHVGHGRNYILGDAVVRYKMMKGFEVLSPMGFDAFGLPAENAALKSNIHPKISTLNNITNMRRQLGEWGCGYDWSREVTSCLPEYYRWTQWIFLKLYERGLAYKKKAPVNWCPSCQTSLANEQVVDGLCERCETKVETRELEQWFFKITAYADRLLEDLALLEGWPERVRMMQANWIGKSHGVEIDFPLVGSNEKFSCFTTRPDTIFGATYAVISPEHPGLRELVRGLPEQAAVEAFIKKMQGQDQTIRTQVETEKEGVFSGRYLMNPTTQEKIPLWAANYVLMEYGTGVVMAVPTHDERDFEFARKYHLPMRIVIDCPAKPLRLEDMGHAYEDPGVMIQSPGFNGLASEEAWQKIAEFMEEKKIGRRTVHYRLKDWLISRQRYWGAPIPMVICESCGTVPVPEKDLPVLLPEDVRFKPTGVSPLRNHADFQNVKCSRCGKNARREPDTMDTFVDSTWYFLRYLSPDDREQAFRSELVNRWLPVSQYIGGIEHAILHLLYSRFINKVFYDMKLINFKEPFERLFTQGMIVKDGAKMSKSKGNVVSPDELIEQYGADTVRLYTLFMGPPEKDAEWSDRGVEGAYRFLGRLWRFVTGLGEWSVPATVPANELERQLHATIKKVTEDMEGDFKFNTAISAVMELLNTVYRFSPSTDGEKQLLRKTAETIVLLLGPFTPHLCEELWEMLGHRGSVLEESWPVYDPKVLLVDEEEIVVQVKGRVRSRLIVPREITEEELRKIALKDSRIKEWIDGKQVKRVVVISHRLVNIVAE